MRGAGLVLALMLAPSVTMAREAPPPPRYEAFDPVFYFHSGGTEIAPPNPEAWAKIEGFIRRDPPDWVEIVAHADSAGQPEANMRLSARRGRAIARLVTEMGVNPTAIRIIACGEHQLTVGTGDGVAERLNRRATIDWGAGTLRRPLGASCRVVPL